MYFYTIDDIELTAKLRYFVGLAWRQNSTYLMFKIQKGEEIKEAKGHYIMYVVSDNQKFESVCNKYNIKYTKLPVDEKDYEKHFNFRKSMRKLNEDLLHTFDDLEEFFNRIAKDNALLQITDGYIYNLSNNQIQKIIGWLKNKNMNCIQFVVPTYCQSQMTNIVSQFNSNGINVTFNNQHIHGRYWIVEDKGFLADASVNTNGAFIVHVLTDGEVVDIKNEYSL